MVHLALLDAFDCRREEVMACVRKPQEKLYAKKSVEMAVPDEGRPPGALVLTKLIEWYRFGVEHKKQKNM